MQVQQNVLFLAEAHPPWRYLRRILLRLRHARLIAQNRHRGRPVSALSGLAAFPVMPGLSESLLHADPVEACRGTDGVGVGERGSGGQAGDVAAQQGEGRGRSQIGRPLQRISSVRDTRLGHGHPRNRPGGL